MIIPVTSADGAMTSEFALIELQGMLDPFSKEEGYCGNDLGELAITAVRPLSLMVCCCCCATPRDPQLTTLLRTQRTTRSSQSNGRGTLIIGHHKLEGKMVVLKRPLCVMRKRTAAAPADAMCVDSAAGTGTASVDYVVAGIVRRKLVFKNRPKPIVRKR